MPLHDNIAIATTPLTPAAAGSSARIDSTRLRYTVRGDQLYVSYPHRDDGHGAYGTGCAVGPIPPGYWTDPPNAITRERAALWADLLGDGTVRQEPAGTRTAGHAPSSTQSRE